MQLSDGASSFLGYIFLSSVAFSRFWFAMRHVPCLFFLFPQPGFPGGPKPLSALYLCGLSRGIVAPVYMNTTKT